MTELMQPLGPSQVRYEVGANQQQSFPVPFRFDDASDIVVSLNGAVTGGWALQGIVLQDGVHLQANVVLTVPVTATIVEIHRATELSQGAAWPNGTNFNVKALNAEFSRVWMALQDLTRTVGNALRGPADEPAFDLLPNAAGRAGSYVVFDAEGRVTVGTALAGTATVSPFGQLLMNSSSALVARNLLGATRQVNVKTDYGAKGDGVTDDRAAIQAAIDSGAPSIYLPPGAYALKAALNLRPYQSIVGDDPLTTYFRPLTNGMTCLQYDIGVGPSNVTGFTIAGLGFQMVTATNPYGIAIRGEDANHRCSIIKITDCYFANGACGIYLEFCANVEITRCFANVCQVGIWLNICADVDVSGGRAQNGIGWGIRVDGGPGAVDEGIRVVGYSTNGQAGGMLVANQEWGQITACSFTTCSIGALLFQAVTGWKVANSEFAPASAARAVQIDGACKEVILTGNYIVTGSIGLDLAGTNHVVSANIFQANTGTDLMMSATHSAVTGNVMASQTATNSFYEPAAAAGNTFAANVYRAPASLAGTGGVRNGDNIDY